MASRVLSSSTAARVLAAAALLALGGCSLESELPSAGPAGGGELGETLPTADATWAPSPGDPLADVWQSVDYLPWEYSPDGCFARSYYVAMELAARGIPASQEVVSLRWMQTATSAPRFTPVDGTRPGNAPVLYRGAVVTWDYHIAALLLPPVVAAPTVLDRAMESGPVPLATWVAHANGGGLPRSAVGPNRIPTAGFNEFTTHGSTYVGVEPSLERNWASVSSPQMSALPAFKAAHLQLACDTVWTLFDCLAAPSDPRRLRLVARTNELAASLAQRGLLDGWSGASVTCAATTFTCAP